MKLMFIMIKIGVPAVMAVCLSCCSGHTAGGISKDLINKSEFSFLQAVTATWCCMEPIP